MARHCGKCGRAGHYQSTCSKKKLFPAKRAKAPTVFRRHTGTVTRSRQGYGAYSGGGWEAFYHGGSTGSTRHNKMWSVKVEILKSGKCRVITRHGRADGPQNMSSRTVQSCQAAINAKHALILQKIRKGYVRIG